jgi:hypothetical protein
VFLHSGVSDNRTKLWNHERLRRVALLGLRLRCSMIGALTVQRLARQLLVRDGGDTVDRQEDLQSTVQLRRQTLTS